MSEGFGGFMFGPPPPEILEEIRRRQEHAQMHLEDNTHAIKQLLDSLDHDQLHALDLMLANCNELTTVSYFRGRIEMLRQIKFNACPCGRDHDGDLAAMGDGVEPDVSSAVEKMREYGLTSDGDELFCANCGMVYQSLQDRMLRAPGPEGCEGCIEKTKWG